MNILFITLIVVYVIGIFVAYNRYIKKWEGHSTLEKIYFSVIWPLTAILYLVHAIHNAK